jgi:hypothetical protein
MIRLVGSTDEDKRRPEKRMGILFDIANPPHGFAYLPKPFFGLFCLAISQEEP